MCIRIQQLWTGKTYLILIDARNELLCVNLKSLYCDQRAFTLDSEPPYENEIVARGNGETSFRVTSLKQQALTMHHR